MILPPDFITRTGQILGEEFRQMEIALQTDSPVSIRTNTSKGIQALDKETVPWCETGYYLEERPAFTFDPLFHAGAYYVQEASSMFLEQAIRKYVNEPVYCLDLCAAPGGKSTHLASLLPDGSLLVCNEVIRTRSHILSENITKWGNPNIIVTNNDPEEIGKLTHLFDVIVTDVPCSGEGMFRKDPESIKEWSISNVELCASRQQRIIHDIWNALKPGGLLIYSTCTYNLEENEENINYITEELNAEALPLPLDDEWQVSGPLKYNHPVYHFFPHKTKGEGFFLAVLSKAEGEIHTMQFKSKKKKEKNKSTPILPCTIKGWINSPNSFYFERRNNYIQAFPVQHLSAYQTIANSLHIVSSGILLGELKGTDIIPAHSLALNTEINKEAFITIELDRKEAIKYLKKEALLLPSEVPKGYILITYKQTPLGFVKNLGNRANNLYPQEWRIRTSYIPEKLSGIVE